MNELEELVRELEQAVDEESIIAKLQAINAMILSKCMLEIDNSYFLYPTEVEAYYYKEPEFMDECVHCNDLQSGDRFGKLYFHRRGKTKDEEIRFPKYTGMDLCLSLNKSYYLGVLIRNAYINSSDFEYGPTRLLRKVVYHICKEDNIQKLSQEQKGKLCSQEDQVVLKPTDDNDSRVVHPIFVTQRQGITTGNYKNSDLRSFIELKQKHAGVKKEDVLRRYFEKEKISVREELLVELLGYKSKAILESFK